MLHIITEIGIPGKDEREKRHYPILNNRPSTTTEGSRGRRYIPHGNGEDEEFRPHNYHIVPHYTEYGLDWSSRLRYLTAPENPKCSTEIWPDNSRSLRTYPGRKERTMGEWAMYPEGYDVPKKCHFDGVHKASTRSSNEVTHSMLFGKGRLVANKRNGIPYASPGDKNYQVVEYSQNFHKEGSTLPIVNFGGNYEPKPDTFVPLQMLPPIPRESYKIRERRRQVAEERSVVRELEIWRPASPLLATGSHHIHDDRQVTVAFNGR